MLTNLNRARGLEVIGPEIPQNENVDVWILVKTEPGKREVDTDGTITQKVAVHDALAYHVRKEDAQYLIAHREN